MKVTDITRSALAVRRERRKLEREGFRRHETDWELHRGMRHDEVIVEARVSVCGKYVYTRLGKRSNAKAAGLDAAGGQSHTSGGLCVAVDTEKEI